MAGANHGEVKNLPLSLRIPVRIPMRFPPAYDHSRPAWCIPNGLRPGPKDASARQYARFSGLRQKGC